jgi:hypothetical protein
MLSISEKIIIGEISFERVEEWGIPNAHISSNCILFYILPPLIIFR